MKEINQQRTSLPHHRLGVYAKALELLAAVRAALAGELEARRKERLGAAGEPPVVTLARARKSKRKPEPPAIDPRQTDLFKPNK